MTIELKCANNKLGMLFCCFDGHGGKEVSAQAEKIFQREFMKTDEF